MGGTDKAVEINLMTTHELCSSLLEQLGEALTELENQRVIPNIKVPWNDIEVHFHNLESITKKKIEEPEAKEKEITERESHNHKLLAEREAAVVAKEQDMLDKLQELKDAAIIVINEARENQIPESLESAVDVNAIGHKVSSSVDAHVSLDTQDEKSPHKMRETNEDAAGEVVIPRAELTQFCEQMDSIGLVKFISENLKNVSSLWKEQLSVSLGSATEPTRFVLNALEEGFFPPNEMTQEGGISDVALSGMRKSCLILMEAMSAFLSKADLATDCLDPDIQQEAKSIANNWKLKLSEDSVNAANENSLEAEGFLQLLATFRIASHFDEEELCKYVLAVSHHRQAIELCRCLDLTQKIPGLVETLIESGRQIDAVYFIHAFELSEAFPPVPLLKTYLKELRKTLQGVGSAALQKIYNARELEAVRAVIKCVGECKLEDAYPLDPLHRRVAQLDRSAKANDRKRANEIGNPRRQYKNPRSDGEFRGPRGRGSGRGRHGSRPPRASYTGVQEMYIPPVPNTYSYPVSSVQSPYAPQVSDQGFAYYSQDIRPPGVYTPAAPSYGSYLQPPHQSQT